MSRQFKKRTKRKQFNFEKEIKLLKKEDFKLLIDLIPEIKSKSEFGTWKDSNEDGTKTFPFVVPVEVVDKFHSIVYDIPIILPFDWGSWGEGRRILADPNTNYKSFDLVTICKLITGIVRNDRFCEGALVGAFESGYILFGIGCRPLISYINVL